MTFILRPAAALAAACILTVRAAPLDKAPVIELPHASWTAREGAPSNIGGIAQTPDGWIWIGSASGLYRFDGVHFLRAAGAQAPLSSNVAGVGVLPDGVMWVGYRYGGVSLMADGRMRHYPPGKDGGPAGTVFSAARDATGRLWLATGRGLLVLGPDGRWRPCDPALGVPDSAFVSMLVDDDGMLWAAGAAGVFALPKGGTRFERRASLSTFLPLVRHPDGSIWATDEARPRMVMLRGPTRGRAAPLDFPRGATLYAFDRDGYAWVADGAGILRGTGAGGPARIHRMWAEHGLSGRKVQAVFEDRERNVWIGTESGLDRFHAPRVRAEALSGDAMSDALPLAGGAGAGVWAGRAFLPGPGGAARDNSPARTGINDTITALHRGPAGDVWAGGFNGLWSVPADGSRWRRLHPGIEGPATFYAMAQDSAGTLWLALGRRGVAAWRDGRLVGGGGSTELAAYAAATVAADRRGRVWFGSVGDDLAVLEGGKVRHYGRADGLAVGTVIQILPADDGAWVGGENGIAHFDGTRFTPVTGRNGEPFTGITGMVFARDGTLWLNGAGGISSIAPAELQRALREPGYPVGYGRIDYRDGLRGTAGPPVPVPSAVRSDDGTLWFTTVGGVYGFDPAALPRNTLVPPVVVTGLKSGTTAFDARDGMRLPAGTEALDIEFSALTYREPGRVAFRYRLDGVDHDWREGGERSAHYTNLGPGRYRFQVLASNDDGVWNTTGASFAFDIAPRLTQMTWFRVLCVVAAVCVAWRLQLFWMRRTARRLALRMNERVAERERIARELHDTLLQSIQGLMLVFWSTASRLTAEARAPLEAALARANGVVAEGRDRVAGLRSTAVPDADLAGALRRFAEPLARDGGIAFRLDEDGRARSLCESAADEAFAIGREALWNAFRHARARQVDVTLQYAPSALVVTVADDGVGLPDDVEADHGRTGHWGIPGMRERARTLGATLTVRTAPGDGTTWTLRVPAPIAYA
ncbi:Two component regulator propeller [Massilia sp. PDC64]|nr:sensor histidine kinase [Massilia sp. PDC64]SDD73656.1 Two component regulator propeller [Massilia sp. PDC64]